MRFHSPQLHLPAQMLSVDLTHVGDKEGIFLAGLTDVGIDALYSLHQSILCQYFSNISPVVGVTKAIFIQHVVLSTERSLLSFFR